MAVTSKIKPYKLVSLGSINTKGGGTVGILKKNLEAINSVGTTLNGLIGALNNYIKLQQESLKLEEGLAKQAKSRETSNVQSVGGPQQERTSSGTLAWVKGAAQSFWSALTNLFGDILRTMMIIPALKWINNPANKKKLVSVIQTISDTLKSIWNWLSDNVIDGLDGFTTMIDGSKNWKERLGGFLKFLLNLGAILIGIRWLTNPVKMIKDFVGVFKLIGKFLKGAARMIRSRAGRWGLAIAAIGGIAAELFTAEDDPLKPSNIAKLAGDAAGFSDDEKAALNTEMGAQGPQGEKGDKGDSGVIEHEIESAEYQAPKKKFLGLFERGGDTGIRMPQPMAMGGLITGPDSGYPVSMTGRGVDFIGHGTEMILGREHGGAFVVPLNNRATRRDPSLTSRRFSEAYRGGYRREKGGPLPSREGGGVLNWVGAQWNRAKSALGGGAKPKASTSTEKTPPKSQQSTENNPYSNLPAVQAVGRMILGKGFTVAEHPNFKKNNHSGSGPNTGGWDPQGKQRVGGHSGGSLHYSNLALDVTDWRSGDWKGRTKALAAELFKRRKQLKLSQIIHDGWGYWFDGQSNYTAAPYGGHDTHLHLGFLRGKADKDAGVGAPEMGGDVGSGSNDITGADTTGASMGTGLNTYTPDAVSDRLAGLNMEAYSQYAINSANDPGGNVLQMSKDNILAQQGAKQSAAAQAGNMLAQSIAQSEQALKKAQQIASAASGQSQDIAIPLGGNSNNAGTHIYIGAYAPKFGLYSR